MSTTRLSRKARFCLAGALSAIAALSFIVAAAPAQAALSDCPAQHVCVWTGANYSGQIFRVSGFAPYTGNPPGWAWSVQFAEAATCGVEIEGQTTGSWPLRSCQAMHVWWSWLYEVGDEHGCGVVMLLLRRVARSVGFAQFGLPGDIDNFRSQEWLRALKAAGLPHWRIYDMRHTFATWSLAAGMSIFTLSRRKGTSVRMIDATYSHLVRDAEDHDLGLLTPMTPLPTAVGTLWARIRPMDRTREDPAYEKPRLSGASLRADEGTRTPTFCMAIRSGRKLLGRT
jgi:hypothetical protein